MSIIINNLTYTYSQKTPHEKRALTDVSFTIKTGETVGIIGSTGSGKSTLIQHINGLIKVQSGSVKVCGYDLSIKKPEYSKVRSMVGMLFQYPEYQLFEDTVLKDVCFGPLNFGYSAEEAKISAKEAIEMVGLNFDEIKDKSPFELSGGEKRRVAIAGVIASRPKILILDEPTAGLDPVGKREILQLIDNLKGGGIDTVIMISHNMDEIAEFADRVLVLSDGKLVSDCSPREFFADEAHFIDTGLSLPHTVNIYNLLQKSGIILEEIPLNPSQLVLSLLSKLKGDKNG